MNKLIREIARFIYMESKYTWDDLSPLDRKYLVSIALEPSKKQRAESNKKWEGMIDKHCKVTNNEIAIKEIKKLIPCFFKEEV